MQQQDPATTSSNTNTADAEFSIDPSLHDAPYSHAADSRKLAGNFAENSPAGPAAHSKPLHATPHAPNTAATNADAEDPEGSKIQQLLQPISEEAGQTPLVLSFEHLSVWAPVNPKKAGWGKQAWRALTCRGGQEANPKRQILYDISGQVGLQLSGAELGWLSLHHGLVPCAAAAAAAVPVTAPLLHSTAIISGQVGRAAQLWGLC